VAVAGPLVGELPQVWPELNKTGLPQHIRIYYFCGCSH